MNNGKASKIQSQLTFCWFRSTFKGILCPSLKISLAMWIPEPIMTDLSIKIHIPFYSSERTKKLETDSAELARSIILMVSIFSNFRDENISSKPKIAALLFLFQFSFSTSMCRGRLSFVWEVLEMRKKIPFHSSCSSSFWLLAVVGIVDYILWQMLWYFWSHTFFPEQAL